MKERPILFSTDMVQALLDGRKTQTRRIKKLDAINGNPSAWSWVKAKMRQVHRLWDSTIEKYSPNPLRSFFYFCDKAGNEKLIQSPYGWEGDLLWVRESFSEIYPGGYEYKSGFTDEPIKWKPSIHMPYVACRIFLQVKEVKVERLQDISEEDAKAEGVITPLIDHGIIDESDSYTVPSKDVEAFYKVKGSWRIGFKQLINQINGLDTWERNPWVWVVKFQVLSTTGRAAAYEKLGKEVNV